MSAHFHIYQINTEKSWPDNKITVFREVINDTRTIIELAVSFPREGLYFLEIENSSGLKSKSFQRVKQQGTYIVRIVVNEISHPAHAD